MQTQNKKAGRPIHSTVELKKRIASLTTQVHYRNHKLKEKSARIVELLKENKELKYQLEQAIADLDTTQTLLNNSGEAEKKLRNIMNKSLDTIERGEYDYMLSFVRPKKDNLFVTFRKWITKTK